MLECPGTQNCTATLQSLFEHLEIQPEASLHWSHTLRHTSSGHAALRRGSCHAPPAEWRKCRLAYECAHPFIGRSTNLVQLELSQCAFTPLTLHVHRRCTACAALIMPAMSSVQTVCAARCAYCERMKNVPRDHGCSEIHSGNACEHTRALIVTFHEHSRSVYNPTEQRT